MKRIHRSLSIVAGFVTAFFYMQSVDAQSILKNPAFKNAHIGIAIFNTENNRYVVDYQGDKYFVPASNTKLLSCYSAMKYLGDSIPGIQYKIVDDTTIFIKGTGDPTFLHPDFDNQPVYDFLKDFNRINYCRANFEDYLGSGWAWNDYLASYMVPRSSMPLYGDLVQLKKNADSVVAIPKYFNYNIEYADFPDRGFNVKRDWEHNTFFISNGRNIKRSIPFVPHDGTIMNLLADTLQKTIWPTDEDIFDGDYIYSRPLDSMLSIMMHQSDNFFAEQSLLMVSEKLLNEMDDAAIIKRILETDFADMPQKPGWVDGSGLSRYNLLSPKDFIFVLNKLRNEFGLERMKTILPTGGTGTLSSLYQGITGSIFAKTGTLNGVVSLSGYLVTRKNHLLLFSILVNNHRTGAQSIRKGIEHYLLEIWKKY